MTETHKQSLLTTPSSSGEGKGRGAFYFLSDAHLGSLAAEDPRMQELRLVRFLDEIKSKATAIYMLGDMFDFWFEYKQVVPKGFTRFLGKLSELTDNGVEVHFFTGNHDIWEFGYLEKECGVIVHHHPEVITINGKRFFLAHGDGLGDPDKKFKFIKSIFDSPTCQWLFRNILPTTWGMRFGLNWAKHSRLKREDGKEPPYMGEDKEFQILYAKEYLKDHPDIDYFIFGHRHIELDLMLSRSTRLMILGDWIWQFTYAVYDGSNIIMENYDE